jgi:hypothetical protein
VFGFAAQFVMMKHARPIPQYELAASPTQAGSLQVPQARASAETPPWLRFEAAGKDKAAPQPGAGAKLMVAETLARAGRVAGTGAAVLAAAGASAAFARDPKHNNEKAHSKAARVFISSPFQDSHGV